MRKFDNMNLTVASICMAQVLGMITFAVYPTLIPVLQAQWSASNTEIGWVAGIYFGGYVVAVGVLVSLTDRVDARRVYLTSMTLSAITPIAFGLLTTDVATASVWRCLQGIGLAGTYMPGLKAIVDAAPAHRQSRTVAVYTACFGLGVGVSFLVSGFLSEWMNWKWVFAASAIGPLIALVIAYFMLPSAPVDAAGEFRFLPDFKPVFRNRTALGFSIAYSVHNVELFVFRAWMVAFLVFAMTQREANSIAVNWNPAIMVAVASFLSQPFSVLTNEIAERFNRVKVIITVMLASAVAGIIVGFSTPLPTLWVVGFVCVYAILSISDSASITAAVITAAESRHRGTTMAFHSLIGFVGAFIGPIVFGAVLDVFGGADKALAWGMAFVAIAAIVLIGPLAIIRLTVSRQTSH